MSQHIELSELKSVLSEIDIFICCASYEKRSISVATALSPHAISHALICYHSEFHLHLEENLSAVKNHFQQKSHVVELSNSEPTITADAISSAILSTIKDLPHASLAVDITTFTRESLLILLKILHLHNGLLDKTKFIYTSSDSMSPEWLSSGFKELRPVLGFAGEFAPSALTHLIVLLGFEVDRVKEIINTTEPSYLSIGIGHEDRSVSTYFHERNKNHLDDLCEFYGFECIPFYYSLTDPIEAMNDIGAYLTRYSDYNNIIAPLNNKISTIGAGLLAINNDKIQLCYSQMDIYNYKAYSMPSNRCYIFDVNTSLLVRY